MKNDGDFINVILLYIPVVGTELHLLDSARKGQAFKMPVDIVETDSNPW